MIPLLEVIMVIYCKPTYPADNFISQFIGDKLKLIATTYFQYQDVD